MKSVALDFLGRTNMSLVCLCTYICIHSIFQLDKQQLCQTGLTVSHLCIVHQFLTAFLFSCFIYPLLRGGHLMSIVLHNCFLFSHPHEVWTAYRGLCTVGVCWLTGHGHQSLRRKPLPFWLPQNLDMRNILYMCLGSESQVTELCAPWICVVGVLRHLQG